MFLLNLVKERLGLLSMSCVIIILDLVYQWNMNERQFNDPHIYL